MRKFITKSVLFLTLTSLIVSTNNDCHKHISAQQSSSASLEAHEGTKGYYIDNYQTNSEENTSPESNVAIATLSEMLKIFKPGVDSTEGEADAWKLGEVLNKDLHMENLLKTKKITEEASEEQQNFAYLADRRNQNYSMIFGLDTLSEDFIKGADAQTSIPDEIPEDAATVEYGEEGDWASPNSKYGKIVQLIIDIRDGSAKSTNPAKNYYQYARPFRWNKIDVSYPEINVIDTLIPRKKPEEEAFKDGGYPSGHTNAAHLAGLAIAYAVPEQYYSILLQASELGNSRIVAGMHSPFDVMGGRILSHAIASAALNDSALTASREEAFKNGRELVSNNSDKELNNQFYDKNPEKFQADKKLYLERLTYGFEQTGEVGRPAKVPKGSEILLETRFPYMSPEERRMVLYTTAIDSGYPLLDDGEGWGRLNLFDAVAGYGSFPEDVMVNLDPSKAPFGEYDVYRNNISGKGGLVKKGLGTLVLTGDNSYSGDTQIEEGKLIARNQSALGKGNVIVKSELEIDTTNGFHIQGDLNVLPEAKLIIHLTDLSDKFIVDGDTKIEGEIEIITDGSFSIPEGYNPFKS